MTGRSGAEPGRPGRLLLRPPGVLAKTRNLDRLRQISEVAVRHGFGYFFERHNLWRVLNVRRRTVPPLPANPGRHVREMLQEMGPTFVKFGQLLSTRPDLVPADILGELVKLQDDVPAFPFSVVRDVIEEDLGLTLERLFVSFDPEPMAAASIGQVHRAVLPGDRQVVVKVQRPEAARLISKDIDLLYQVAEIIRDQFGDRLFVDPVELVAEFARSISRELDYLLEGRNAERFAANFGEGGPVRVPRVFWSFTRKRVLTLEYIEGRTLNALDFGAMSPGERSGLAHTLGDAWFKQILDDGYFHADPHPANIVYVEPGQVALLDFGIVGTLSQEDFEQGVSLFLDIMDRDIRGCKRHLRKLGISWDKERDAEFTESLERLFSSYFGVTFGEIDPATVIREVFDIIRSLRMTMPTRFLMLDKSLVTIEGVVATVYPEYNVFSAARPYARRLLQRRYLPTAVVDRAGRTVGGYVDLAMELPYQLHDVLEEFRDGEMKINFMHRGLDDLFHRLDVVTNRVVIALLAATMILASAVIAVFVDEGPTLFGVSLLGIPGFMIASFFGVWLMWAIFRSGRL